MRVVNNLPPVLFRKHARVYILMARTKTKTCRKAEGRATTNPSLTSLSRGGGGRAYLFPARLKSGGGL